MKFTVSREAMLQGLSKLQAIVATKPALPILSNALIKAAEGQIELTTTDLELSVRTVVEAKIEQAGSITLPVRKLFSICREVSGDELLFSMDDASSVTLRCASSRFKINGLSDEDFPEVPDCSSGHAYTLEQATFREMLQKTGYAASTDDTRYMLNGVLLSFKEEKLTVVATDGRRLALVEQEMEFPVEAEQDFILPSKAVNELVKTLNDNGTLQIQASKTQISFNFSSMLIVSKLIEGKYPNFKQVIPSGVDAVRITIEREELLIAVRRASLVTSEQSSSLLLAFGENRLDIKGESSEVGEANESLAVKYDGPEIRAAFNPEFLMAPLRNLESDEVYLELTDELSPGVLKTDVPFLYVLMPMRLNS